MSIVHDGKVWCMAIVTGAGDGIEGECENTVMG